MKKDVPSSFGRGKTILTHLSRRYLTVSFGNVETFRVNLSQGTQRTRPPPWNNIKLFVSPEPPPLSHSSFLRDVAQDFYF